LENGAPFMISWNGSRDFGNCYVKNIDIIRVEHEWDNENLAVICAVHGGRANISRFVFDNIRIDNSQWRVFHLVTRPNRWGRWYPDEGSLSDMTFRNIQYNGTPRIKNLIMGHDLQHPVYNMTFENLTISGERITNLNKDKYFYIEPEQPGTSILNKNIMRKLVFVLALFLFSLQAGNAQNGAFIVSSHGYNNCVQLKTQYQGGYRPQCRWSCACL
jgi:hypothetical protein